MTQRIRLRRGTAAQWTAADPVLLSGEPGFSTDDNVLKVGNGSDAWSALSGLGGGGGGGGTLGGGTPATLDAMAGGTLGGLAPGGL